MPDPAVTQCLERQAASCRHIGSPLYASLFTGLAGDHGRDGLTAELLDGVTAQPLHDALALRYVAAVHLLALAGEAADLAAWYPSCGGSWTGDDPTARFLATVADHRDEVRDGLRRNVQTNEVGRSVALHAGMRWLSDRWQLPLRTLEVGASAGLLSQLDRYGYDDGRRVSGDPSGPLRFGPEWYDVAPELPVGCTIDDRAASDVSPIDVRTEQGRLSMLSFVWPDQLDRIGRLRTAIDIAVAHPLDVESGDAGAWVEDRLGVAADGVGTVVFHSIVWQYLPTATRVRLRAALEAAATRATTARPLAWLRMEPASLEFADLRVTVWPSGEEYHLADVGYHGAHLSWAG